MLLKIGQTRHVIGPLYLSYMPLVKEWTNEQGEKWIDRLLPHSHIDAYVLPKNDFNTKQRRVSALKRFELVIWFRYGYRHFRVVFFLYKKPEVEITNVTD